MSFDFFTFGGGHLWEDVFFYQKWRIQRNYTSKVYRLLDPWDIRRHKGTFEECRRAFVKFIEIYEISRQKGHMIIMLHGLSGNKNMFKPLWRKALEEGFMAAAINYPSTRKHIDSHVRQLDFLLNNLEDVNEVSFVSHGAGGLILRKLLNNRSLWRERLKIRRIVQISPPNKGSRFFSKLGNWAIFRWWLGPMLQECSPEKVKLIPNFPKSAEFGILYADYALRGLAAFLPRLFREKLPSPKEADLPGAKESIFIKNIHKNPFNNRKVVNATVNFLKNGRF